MKLRVDPEGNPILDQFSEEGFIDCVFKIKALEKTNNSYKFHMTASYDEEVLGVDVEVIQGIVGGFDPDMNLIKSNVYQNGVIFRRSGEESDRLICVLSDLYGIPSPEITMVEEERFTGIGLYNGYVDMEENPIKIKLFGRDGEPFIEEEYNESFFNLDLKNGFVFWNEKDQEYRQPLINGLSK